MTYLYDNHVNACKLLDFWKLNIKWLSIELVTKK